VTKTVAAREGKVRAACLEISIIVNDWRAKIVGGMETALLLWEACCIPTLLHGAGSWVEMSPSTEKKLNSLQYWYLRLILQVGPGTPLVSLLFETGMLDMGIRVWREKLMLAFHLRSMKEGSLARSIYEEQISENFPGLAREVKVICEELSIENVNITRMDKRSYKKLLNDACHKLNEKRLRKNAEGKEKCHRIMREEYRKKAYMSGKIVCKVREQFRTRVGLQAFAGNYSHDRRFADSQWLCKCLQSLEKESHILAGTCSVYGGLNKKYDNLDNDEQLINFFNEVLAMRDTIREEDV
jgi:hypothetical protein